MTEGTIGVHRELSSDKWYGPVLRARGIPVEFGHFDQIFPGRVVILNALTVILND
jgi:hypothetical protein